MAHMRMLRPVVGAIVVVLGAGFLAGCGSSSKEGDASPPTTTAAETADESCPFSGTTDPQEQPGGDGASTLGTVTPSRDGCIDNLQFEFAPTLAASSAKYDGNDLVITLDCEPGDVSDIIDITQLDYVSSASIEGKNPGTEVVLTLDKPRPYLMSSSKVPAQLEIAIGLPVSVPAWQLRCRRP